MNFSQLLQTRVNQTCPVSLGIDPDIRLMHPAWLGQFDREAFGKTINYLASVYEHYGRMIVDVAEGLVPVIKLQMAFFEVLGSVGIEVVENLIQYARSKGLIVIVDVKRSDIPATSAYYARAYLEENPLESDAMTVVPYLGLDSLRPFVDQCQKHDKGVFICLKTSNPGSGDLQNLTTRDQLPVFLHLATQLLPYEAELSDEMGLSSLGVVVGATYPEEAKAVRTVLKKAFFLVPGLGHQGGRFEDCSHYLNSQGQGALFHFSRSVIYPRVDQLGEKFLEPNFLKDQIQRSLKKHIEKVQVMM